MSIDQLERETDRWEKSLRDLAEFLSNLLGRK
jgi:hypothetical protein